VNMVHYIKRVLELGPKATMNVLKNRYRKKRLYQLSKRRALAHKVHHEWERIAARHNVQQSFPSFLWRMRYTSADHFPVHVLQPFANDNDTVRRADLIVAHEYDLLGFYGVVQYQGALHQGSERGVAHMPWHIDFRLKAANPTVNCTFHSHQFYQDIVVQAGAGTELAKDIKVPWELSRCYHFAVLGQAYQATCDTKYVDTFVEHVESWIHENPFLLGVNWVCPMEVGIRAINWVCAFYYFKTAPQISGAFWKRFVCTLYDHLMYLEQNWEVYDSRTSNHYLSDLVGYYAVCCFFIDLPGIADKQAWCAQEIMREWNKQVFAEGADYEGSTAYHGLVTELFFVFSQFAQHYEPELVETMQQSLAQMIDFLTWCRPHETGSLVTIGDNDSGRVLYHGISGVVACAAQRICLGVRHFPEFGLSVYRSEHFHSMLRHHVYTKRQPSGHFHNDAGSITLAVQGIPVFIDPGSFVYTPSTTWRNYFRSVAVHNTSYLEGIEPCSLDEHLFGMPIPEQKPRTQDFFSTHLSTAHHLYADYGLEYTREVEYCDAKSRISITDCWLKYGGVLVEEGQIVVWNFTLAPGIDAIFSQGIWHLCHQGHTLIRLYSPDLMFSLHDAWHSPAYGEKVATHSLRARQLLEVGRKMSTTLALQKNI
jgi:hypothetical protein